MSRPKDQTQRDIAGATSETFSGYDVLLGDIKSRVQSAQIKASLAVNRELILLYWSIGRDILLRQKEQGWGTNA